MLGKLFSKKEAKGGDIESLKQRFNQINGQKQASTADVPVTDPAQPVNPEAPKPPGADISPIQPKIEKPVPPGNTTPIESSKPAATADSPVSNPASSGVSPTPDSPQSAASPTEPASQSTSSPVPASQPNPPDTDKPDFEVVEIIEGGNNLESVSLDQQPAVIQPEHKAPADDPKKMGATKISKYLDDLKDELDDTKLTSLIIQQVKELIEIDQNLNNKIRDIEDNLKKEGKEREKLKDQIDKHYDEFKKSEKNMDKFIALYEVVTNQFNPFIEQTKVSAPVNQNCKPEVQNCKPAVSIPEIPKTEPDTKMVPPVKSAETVPEEKENHQKEQKPIVPPMEEKPEGGHNDSPIPKSKEESNVNLEELPSTLHFQTKDGQTIKNLQELVTLLKGMSSDVFTHHVTPTGNDFSAWVHHVLKNEELAKELGPIKNRLDMIRAIMKHL